MKMSAWDLKLKLGHLSEFEITRILHNPDKVETLLEVKTDFHSPYTDKFFIEYERATGEKSGLAVTESDYYALVAATGESEENFKVDYIIIVPTERLKAALHRMLNLGIIEPGAISGEGNAVGLIVPLGPLLRHLGESVKGGGT